MLLYVFTVYTHVHIHMCIRNGKEDPNKYDDVKGEDTSIQGSPTAVTYAATAKAPGADTHAGPALQYDYARTGAITVRKY